MTLDGGGGIQFITGVLVSSTGLESGRDFQPKPYFTANTVDAGTLVLKHTGAGQPDEFVSGFKVH